MEQFDAYFHAVQETLAHGKAIVTYCVSGTGRTGTMIAAWLIVKEGLPAQTAIELIRKLRGPDAIDGPSQQIFLTELELKHRAIHAIESDLAH